MQQLKDSGLAAKLTGAPVMQLEIRNAVERDQMTYNGLGLLFGAVIAAIFFRRVSLMLVAALPPVLAVIWSLGLLGWMGFKLNLFLNVMTPLIMVMGFADSMQMVSAIRIRLREGDDRYEAVNFAVSIVGPACVVAHGAALLSFLALLFSESALIRTFGVAGAIAVCVSFVAVILVLPLLAVLFIRNEETLAKDHTPADALMDSLGTIVGGIVDRVVHRPVSLFAPRLRAVRPVRGRLRRPADALPACRSGARPRAGARCDGPHRPEAHRRQSGARDDPVEATARRSIRPKTLDVIGAGAQRAREGSRPRQRLVARKPAALAARGGRRQHRDGEEVRRHPARPSRAPLHRGGENAVLVTGRLPDIDASHILPVVEKIDHALDPVRAANPSYQISVTGLPAIAARNSARMIDQLNESIPICVAFAGDPARPRLPLALRRRHQPPAGPLPGPGVGRAAVGARRAGSSSPRWWR